MNSPEQHQHRLGRRMIILMWVVLLPLLYMLFNNILEKDYNPNQDPYTLHSDDGNTSVTLQRNRYGHYVTSGSINGQPVVFFVDTGATDIAIPEAVAKRLRLRKGPAEDYHTANGVVTAYLTRLNEVNIAGIKLHNVRASISPSMRDDEILLGMSFLKQIEFTQRGDTLILRQMRNHTQFSNQQ